jgi:protein involved in polysaccharide export with SLBB domain
LRGGVLGRRVQRLINPRFKEESVMKKFFVLAFFTATAIVPLVRVEGVSGDDEAARPTPPAKAAPPEQKPLTVAEFMKRPRELDPKRIAAAELSDYVIEPPDVLLIEAANLIPKSSLRLGALDEVLILAGTGARLRIDGKYTIDNEGNVNLGAKCGRVHLAGLTAKEAEGVIQNELIDDMGKVPVGVTLHTGMNAQQINGKHLVGMDGCVNLGDFGTVYVAGMTPREARAAIEQKLAERLEAPAVLVEVASYNSKVAYVILQGDRAGDEVSRLSLPYPLAAEWNVGKALASGVYPQPVDFSKTRITLKRPAPDGKGEEREFPVAWDKKAGKPTDETNHAVLPGDRIFIDCSGSMVEHWAPPAPAALAAISDQAKPLNPGQVKYDIAFVADPDGTMDGFEALQKSHSLIGDSETALGALRILEKHKLVTRSASPSLVTMVGRPASFELSRAEKLKVSKPKVSIESRQLDKGHVVIEVKAEHNERMSAVGWVLDSSRKQTIIIKLAPPEDAGSEKRDGGPASYVFVTPEWVGDDERAAR